MSGGRRRVFVYPDGRTGMRGVFIILTYGAVAILLAGAIVNPGLLGGAVVVAFFAWVATSLFLLKRPIVLSDERIDALLGRWRWRTIAWRDVDRIEKRVRLEERDPQGSIRRHFEVIYFRSGRRSISAMSTLIDFAALKQLAAEKAKQRGIELVLAEPQPLWRAPILTPLDEL